MGTGLGEEMFAVQIYYTVDLSRHESWVIPAETQKERTALFVMGPGQVKAASSFWGSGCTHPLPVLCPRIQKSLSHR